MRISILILTLSVIICSCAREKKLKVHYLVLIDSITPEIINDFDKTFNDGKSRALISEQPDTLDLITFTAYIPSPKVERINATFEYDNSDKNNKSGQAENFLTELKGKMKEDQGDKFILNALNVLLSDIKDTGTIYKILFLSDMIECSGNSNSKEEWLNGCFHFKDESGNCNSEHLNEAIRQLSDSTSWVYQNLILKCLGNPVLRKQNLNLKNNFTFDLRKSIGGCGPIDISKFWTTLFKKMQISYATYSGSLKEYLSLKEINSN